MNTGDILTIGNVTYEVASFNPHVYLDVYPNALLNFHVIKTPSTLLSYLPKGIFEVTYKRYAKGYVHYYLYKPLSINEIKAFISTITNDRVFIYKDKIKFYKGSACFRLHLTLFKSKKDILFQIPFGHHQEGYSHKANYKSNLSLLNSSVSHCQSKLGFSVYNNKVVKPYKKGKVKLANFSINLLYFGGFSDEYYCRGFPLSSSFCIKLPERKQARRLFYNKALPQFKDIHEILDLYKDNFVCVDIALLEPKPLSVRIERKALLKYLIIKEVVLEDLFHPIAKMIYLIELRERLNRYLCT